MIVDEIILMFLAGSFTLKTTNTNMLSYLAMNLECKGKLIQELKETILKNHLAGPNKSKLPDTSALFTYESID